MNIKQWHDWFDYLIDKTGSPYYTSDEKDLLFNRAIISYVTRFLDDNIRSDRAEASVNDTEELATLIYQLDAPVGVDGKVLYQDLKNDYEARFGEIRDLMYVLNVARTEDNCINPEKVKSRFLRHNDVLIHKENSFKTPDTKYPTHTYFHDHLLSLPMGHGGAVSCAVLMQPREVTLDDPNDTGQEGANAVSSDMPEKTHNDILMLALRLSSISIREAELMSLTQAADAFINPPNKQ